MKTNIKATNVELTAEIREYLEKKLNKVGEVIGEDSTLIAEIEVGKTTNRHQSGDIFRAEINLTMAGGKFRSEVEKSSLFAAIDEAQEEILREQIGAKNKKISLIRKGGRMLKNLMKKFYK